MFSNREFSGRLLGAIFMSIVQNGMLMAHVHPFWQNVVVGLIMILAVGIDQFRRKKMSVIA